MSQYNFEDLINQAKADYTTQKRQDELKVLQQELKVLKPAYDQIKAMPAEEQVQYDDIVNQYETLEAEASALEALIGE